MELSPLNINLIDLAIRATLLLGASMILGRLIRRHAGSSKHLMWTTALAAVVLLPVLTMLLPRPGLPWLEIGAGRVESEATAITQASARLDAPIKYELTGKSVVEASPSFEVQQISSAVPGTRVQSGLSLLLMIWLAGSILSIVSLLIGMFRARLLASDALRVVDPFLLERLAVIRNRLGITRSVSLGLSHKIGIPVTGGVVRPFVLLPFSVAEWDGECIDSVLTHELIHVQRADVLRQMVARLAVALNWFHPLAWRAAREAMLVREQACDEAVIATGISASKYARHLLALADTKFPPIHAPSLVGLDHAHLENRVMSLLNLSSKSQSRIRSLFASAGIAVLALLIASAGSSTATAQVPAAPPKAPAPPVVVPALAPPSAPEPILARMAPVAPMVATVPTPSPAPKPVVAMMAPPAPGLPKVAPPLLPAAPEPMVAPSAPSAPVVPVLEVDECDNAVDSKSDKNVGGKVHRKISTVLGNIRLCGSVSGRAAMPRSGPVIPEGKLPTGTVVILAATGPEIAQRMVIAGAAAGNTHTWYVDNKVRPFDNEAREWRDAMLEALNHGSRRSLVAEQRAKVDVERAREVAVKVHEESIRALKESEIARRDAMAEQQDKLMALRESQMQLERQQVKEVALVNRRLAEVQNAEQRQEVEQQLDEARAQIAERRAKVEAESTRVRELRSDRAVQVAEKFRERLQVVEERAHEAAAPDRERARDVVESPRVDGDRVLRIIRRVG